MDRCKPWNRYKITFFSKCEISNERKPKNYYTFLLTLVSFSLLSWKLHFAKFGNFNFCVWGKVVWQNFPIIFCTVPAIRLPKSLCFGEKSPYFSCETFLLSPRKWKSSIFLICLRIRHYCPRSGSRTTADFGNLSGI